MENPHLMLAVCLAAPRSMMLFVFRGRARRILGFLLAGVFMCLFAGEVNGLIRNCTSLQDRFLTVNITPITEETLKALPVVFFAFLMKPDRQTLLECSLAVGVGFATMENVCLLSDNTAAFSAGLLVARGFGAGMMHGVSTFAVGYSMTVASSDRKLSWTGTVAALSAAIIYHSVYNIMVQSAYPILGVLLPAATYVPAVLGMKKQRDRRRSESGYAVIREKEKEIHRK